MPELPEVETIVRNLRQGNPPAPSIVKTIIKSSTVFWKKTIQNLNPEEFNSKVEKRLVMNVLRRGKYLHIPLDEGHLIIHLRMSGDLTLIPKLNKDGTPFDHQKHDRVVFLLEDDWWLVFNDPRKFGRIWLVNNPSEVFYNLGPDPFDPQLTPKCFQTMLNQHNRMIKPLLMDQTFLAGMGNIYTDEALFNAQIHPQRTSDQIDYKQATKLLESIQFVLSEGIRRNGASIDWVYRGGEFQNYFQVYQRIGEPCPRCGTPIKRIVIGQRGTHFCPQCQPLKSGGENEG